MTGCIDKLPTPVKTRSRQIALRSWLLGLAFLHLPFSSPALTIRIEAASIEHPSLPAPLKNLTLECSLSGSADEPTCRQGRLGALLGQQPLAITFTASKTLSSELRLSGESQFKALTFSDASGRYASEELEGQLQFNLLSSDEKLEADVELSLPAGQAYAEPVFMDFSQAPASIRASLKSIGAVIDIRLLEVHQQGLVKASGRVRLVDGRLTTSEIDAHLPNLVAANETYLQPFVLGTSWEAIHASGAGRFRASLEGTALQNASLQLEKSELGFGDQARWQGVEAELHWATDTTASPSMIRWERASVSKLPLEGASASLQLYPRGLSLMTPLRIGVAGGALTLHQLSLRGAGETHMSAELDAEIEPIDLAALCRALGWPEFSGQLSGRLPGLRLSNNELRLDGALTAEAFDGKVTVGALRVLDPFGRIPRVVSDLSLRNLDLAALTSAFSFGRIEGRLDGDIKGLRLRRWQAVAFDARIGTPPDDRSRHRISQKAIDNISSIGGGPTGLLSRGVMRFFDDFAYDRIGWRCVLRDGICHMDGLEPSGDGGYVLVKGRWLPRIDVVGYSRRVDWETFLQQVQQAISTSGDISVR